METSEDNCIIVPSYSLSLPKRGLYNPTHCHVTCVAAWGRSVCPAPLTLALTPWLPLPMAVAHQSRELRAIASFYLLTCSCPLPQDWHVPMGAIPLAWTKGNCSHSWPTAKRSQATTELWRQCKKGKKWALMVMSCWEVGIGCYCSYSWCKLTLKSPASAAWLNKTWCV